MRGAAGINNFASPCTCWRAWPASRIIEAMKPAICHLDKESFRRYTESLRRFAVWESSQRFVPQSAADAVAAAGFLYDLLPQESRTRPVDVSGVRILHSTLALLHRGTS